MLAGKFIVHIDMDAFFASIEQRDNPHLRSKPVVVGADPRRGRGRGVVSTCSYEARKFGIRSAMSISEAYRRCPDAAFLPVDIVKYEKVSGKIYEILYSFTPDIEPAGIDEAFLDITGSYHLFGTPIATCKLIKAKIRTETALTASIGLAPAKMAAKIASDLRKPDGLVEVTDEGLFDFLWPLDVRRIWGLGEKSQKILNRMGIATIGDLARRDTSGIVDALGKNGMRFWQLANGIDDKTVRAESDPKSISNEITFDEDTYDKQKIESAMMSLCEKVSWRLRQANMKTRTITLKIRLEGFHTFTRSATIDEATNFVDVLYNEVKELYNAFDAKGKKTRLVGVKASGVFSADYASSLFNDREFRYGKTEKIHSVVDKIKERFGISSIFRAGGALANLKKGKNT